MVQEAGLVQVKNLKLEGSKPSCGDYQRTCRETKLKEVCERETERKDECVAHFMAMCNNYPCKTMDKADDCCVSGFKGTSMFGY